MSSNSSVDRQIVSSNEVPNRGYRLDPSRYSETGERINRQFKENKIQLKKLSELPEFKEVFLPNWFSRIYLEDLNQGAPMLGTSTMLMTKLPIDNRIRTDGIPNQSELLIQDGDILISRSGTVAKAVLCGKSYSESIASEHCFRLRVSEKISGYIVAYLDTPIGRTLLMRNQHGKVIHELTQEVIENIQVPIIDEKKMVYINTLMHTSKDLIDDARQLFKEAEDQLYAELKISKNKSVQDNWINKANKTFLKDSISFIDSRLDPHSYHPDADNTRKKILLQPHKKLGEISQVWGVPRFKRLRADKGHGISFYSSSDIMRVISNPSGSLSAKRNARNIELCRVNKGDILIPCSGTFGGILGRCVMTTKFLDQSPVTQHAIRCRVNDPEFLVGYLYAYLSSQLLGYRLLTALRYGKDVPEISPDEVKHLPIPKMHIDNQRGISEKILKAYEKIEDANDLVYNARKELLLSLKMAG